MLTMTMGMYRQQHEAKRVEQDPEWESAGAKVSPKEAPVPAKALQAVSSDSRAVSPTETTRQGERDRPWHRGTHSCPLPPDNTQDGRHEGGRASSCPHPYGGVCQMTNYLMRRPHTEFISSTLRDGGLR